MPSTVQTLRALLKLNLKSMGAWEHIWLQTSPTTPLKIGDTPSLLYVMNGDLDDPESPSWGGEYDLVPGRKHFWKDKPSQSSAHATISIHLGNPPNPGINTIYGDWINSMKRAGIGCDVP